MTFTPPVQDPMGPDPIGPDPDPDFAQRQPDGSWIIPASFPASGFVGKYLTNAEGCVNLAQTLNDSLQAAEALREAKELTNQAEQLSKMLAEQTAVATQATLQAQTMAQELERLKEMVCAGPVAQAAQPAEEDDRPIPHAKILPLNPRYVLPDWFKQECEPRLAQFGRDVLGLIGGAGVGKSVGLMQWAARTKTPCVILNAKNSDPNEWFEYRSANDGSTAWTPGILTEVIQRGARTVIIIEEPDTSPTDFQMRLSTALEMDPSQRRIDTPFGSFPVGPNLQWCLAMNGNGTDPSSRHRGTLAEALINRITWVEVPMLEEGDIYNILRNSFPAEGMKVAQNIARTIHRLMLAAQRGEIDADCSIRTAIKVLRSWSLGPVIAWRGGLLSALSDPKMKSKAAAIIGEMFPEVSP